MDTPLLKYVLGLADDNMVLSQRLTEWCSNGPTLEEDIALTNVALDILGRARMFYQYASVLDEQKRSEDDFAMCRSEREYTNLLIHELPIGDFAFTMARQWFLDEFSQLYFSALSHSKDETLAGIAAKCIKESGYHLVRSRNWICVLAEGTEESRRRLLAAIDELWGYRHELFETTQAESLLSGVAVNRADLKDTWMTNINDLSARLNIELPDKDWFVTGGRRGEHSEHLGPMLAEMQYLARCFPGAKW
ncbi:phenylacetate-CoA oxygenase subunit PaaC [Shewanella corallii]|uniref:Phenylacetate-CoA oxygenase subunit PaaC n=1 Tax=Shewanella corallii TaxID=560080 RepID=A0ABT0N5W2_9GAMM|nr:1,2-phenylacetyl-CoA epoxidase subunit PaaC [Shewanella corallii]MCL2913276.1 phenylacetate-CoA oxygenase subunit PaaC [Shewanella corallii]